ncbi:hypothetical protein CTI12_AA083680 [Artemisia annua]|uniref:Lipase-like C-terminal domain-containing protein n=1 Tax=Artemisia annua TaxID=35608 RepID=A0A2U1Q1T7_ARTAN|nr:hypothetical protein CTI12_AA083680 [Artemisia annua]
MRGFWCLIWDRARELFYYLKGGQVDYGEEHSKACGHSQFGRIYEQGATDIDGTQPRLNITNNEVDADLDLKRRRTNIDTVDVTPVIKPIHEPRLVV